MSPKRYLGEFEQMVLLAIMRIGESAYGISIIDESEQRTGRSVSRGALYLTLDRLETKRLIASKLGEPTSARGGRAKRYVRVTPKGRAALRASHAALTSLWKGLETELKS